MSWTRTVVFLGVLVASRPAAAWYHAGAAGTAHGGGGSWSGHGAYGGSASGGGGTWHGTTAYGTSVYGGPDRYYGGTYATYHPPTVVNHYYGAGCSDCGGWSTAGAAAAGVALGAAGAVVASQNAYAAGYAAGSGTVHGIGAIYPALPPGCLFRPALGVYECSGTWFKPAYGAGGVYYRVVPAP